VRHVSMMRSMAFAIRFGLADKAEFAMAVSKTAKTIRDLRAGKSKEDLDKELWDAIPRGEKG